MERGFYITANDKFTDYSIALLNSIRATDPDTPVMLIPYDDNYQEVAKILSDRFGVMVFEDLDFIARLSKNLQEIFGDDFFARPNQFRKQACWFGPFEKFLYIDTDIVVFRKLADIMDGLEECDFICCDYQHAGGLTNVFSPTVLEQGVFSQADLQGMFNGGLWGSKKALMDEEDLYEVFRECASHPDYFDFSQKTSDQPIINYMVLKRFAKRRNYALWPERGPGSWAGSKHFRFEGDRLVDPKNGNKPLDYLHWAGFKIGPGCPYWEVWEDYRYRGETKPEQSPLASVTQPRPSPLDRLRSLKQRILG